MRTLFKKDKQRMFIHKILESTGSPSLKELSNRTGINYSSLKNYYSGDRSLPENLFNDLCFLGGINPKEIKFKLIPDNLGQIKGGKISKR